MMSVSMLQRFLRNSRTLLTNPGVARDYVTYCAQRMTGQRAVRSLCNGIRVAGLTGFSEYRAVNYFLDDAEQRFLSTYSLPPGDIIDVGANVGVFSLYLAKQFPERVIHAFEPNPSTCEALRGNVLLNGRENIRVQQRAVSDREGTLRFNADPVRRGTARVALAGDPHPLEVPCTTLDAYVAKQGITSISLMKIDVEGVEAQVLRGARRMLEQQIPRIIFYEVCPTNCRNMKINSTEATRLLLQHGYSIHRLNGEGELMPASIEQIGAVRLENWIALAASSV